MAEKETIVGDTELAHATTTDTAAFDKEFGNLPGDQDASTTDDDDGDSEDRTTRVDHELQDAPDDDARDKIRAARRSERQRRKNNRQERVDTLERTVSNLVDQNKAYAETLNRLQSSDASAKLNQLDDAISEAGGLFKQYQSIQADAIAKSDGTTAAEALERMLQARDRFTQLTNVKNDIVTKSNQPRAPAIDPVVRKHASTFASKNTWYQGPSSQDSDSKLMTFLDNQVMQEGFSPATPAYWQELETRAKRYIPHRFTGVQNNSTELDSNDGDDDSSYNSEQPRRGPRSPVAGASQQRSITSENGGGYRLSAERVKVMKEAGIWDDPKRRAKVIADYKIRDRDAAR